MKRTIFLATALIIIMSACTKNNIEPSVKEDIEGVWVEQSSEKGVTIYQKSLNLTQNNPGFKFKSDGTLINRISQTLDKTTPTYFTNNTGIWEKIEKNKFKLQINQGEYTKSYYLSVIFNDGSILKANIAPTLLDDIIGKWVYDYDEEGGTSTVYKKADEFEEDNHGIEFKPEGIFVQRQINGWCGTPPVVYENYAGTWSNSTDSILDIESEFWGGTHNYKLNIINVNSDNLRVKYIFPQNK